jgi:hypothetical protein
MMSFLDSVFRTLRPTHAAAPANDIWDPIEELRKQVRCEVASGFYDWPKILENAEGFFGHDIEADTLRAETLMAFDQASTAHLAEQSTWPKVTDCDRLDAAFADLEAEGVIARHNFWCCQSCGMAAIWDEVEACETGGRAARGYAFYHEQDTESAVAGDGLYLSYGDAGEGEAAALAIGHHIVRKLEKRGLKTDWNGSLDKRIRVSLDWKRRPAGSVSTSPWLN